MYLSTIQIQNTRHYSHKAVINSKNGGKQSFTYKDALEAIAGVTIAVYYGSSGADKILHYIENYDKRSWYFERVRFQH